MTFQSILLYYRICTLSLSLQYSINHSKSLKPASYQISTNHLMKFHRQKARPVSSRTCQKDSANSIEIACVSGTKSVIFQVVVCYCHLGAESRRIATVGSTRENRKPRVELTFNRAGLACYEGKMSRIARVATLAGERAKKKEIRERLKGGGSVA